MAKEKKKHKKDKKEKAKKRRQRSSSSSSSSSENEWVEKEEKQDNARDRVSQRQERDEWMNIPSLFSGMTRDEMRQRNKVETEKPNILDQPGQSDRELNPYWKNGGTGLPSTSANVASDKTGDRQRFTDSGYRRREEQNYRKSLFKKPDESSTDCYSNRNTKESHHSSHSRTSSSRSGWRKTDSRDNPKSDNTDIEMDSESTSRIDESKERAKLEQAFENLEFEEEDVERVHKNGIMTRNELNRLAARLIKAEIMGKTELAASLQTELDRERNRRETVILTVTDNKGFVRPVRDIGQSAGSRRQKKVETHQDGKRVRYFADDDKFSLQDIFEREKLGKSSSYDEEFYKLSKKRIGNDGSARDIDDVFEESARFDQEGKDHERERKKAIREHQRKEKAYEFCNWCLDKESSACDHIVSLGNQIYLCVPPYQSLTDGHCLIIPNQHVSCATLLDEDVWGDIMDMRKALVQYYQSQDEDVIFFENATNLGKHPHMVIHSVPVPKEIGDMAPIYFKKAIEECEMEWATNKKLVELAGKGIRRAVPKGLSYFAVDFGMQDGFAHVIEDRKLFPNNFAQEIIGGMLDLDHSLWRKPRREHPELLIKKVSEFKKLFETYNPIK